MPPKPSNTEVLEALHSLNVGMGAELVAMRLEIEKLNQTIVGLSHMMAKATNPMLSPPDQYYKPLPKVIYTEDDIIKACYPLNASEKQAAVNGHLIDAIKSYRTRIKNLTGVMPDLKATKDLVETYKNGAPPKPAFDPLSPPPLLESHKHFVMKGLKIDAIKAYRQYTMEVCNGYAGLKEAKDIIDAYAYSIDKTNWKPTIQFVNQPW